VPGLAALDEIDVGFEEREELLVHGDRLLVEDPAPGLRDHALGQAPEVLDLRAQGADGGGPPG